MNKYALLFTITLIFQACALEKKQNIELDKVVSTVDELLEHSHEFDKAEVVKVTEGIHVAIGFGLANSILIEGENGNIIIDCMESDNTAKRVKAEFDKISNKPVKAIIYTHNHADHIFGAKVMAGDDKPAIYAHTLTNYYIDRLVSVVQPIIGQRSSRMFGNFLDTSNHINCGIGPFLDNTPTTARSLLRPTVMFEDELEVEIEGVKMHLVHQPGEANDEIFVWLPEKKALMCGDNLYKSFPNLYTIRGTPYRDVKQWANSLDKMRYLNADYLVPSHTQPIIGEDTIRKVLTDYADAVRFVHDQTIRYMNLGFSPDEIAEKVILPPHLSRSPYLKEFYGRVDWSVKNIFNGYLGWFDGNPSNLLPLSLYEKAQKMADLAGGEKKLMENAQTALENKSYQWALELTDYLMRLSPDDETVKNIRFECLIELGALQSNANARNYYLSQAIETRSGDIDHEMQRPLDIVHSVPLQSIFDGLVVHLDPQKCLNYNKKLVFNFTDIEEEWTVWIRNGVAEIQAFALENPDITVSTKSTIWKEIAAEVRSPIKAIASGDLKVEGGLNEFRIFFGKFVLD